MSLFNKLLNKRKKVKNKAGAMAYKQSAEMQLASLLLTSFAQDQFYRSAKDTFQELIALLSKVDPQFAAKAAIYARNEFGMRSITHVLAAELAAYISGKEWGKAFYDKVVRRPDDMLETLAYYYAKGGKTVPNAMRKGFAKAFDKFDAYQLAKYRGERKSVTLVDLVNLVHPTPTQRNAKALQDLVNGTLRNENTWEAKLTRAGQASENAKDKVERKAEAWAEMVRSGKIGYFALLRNLRNIVEQAPEVLDEALVMLTDDKRIRKSLVMPFRYLVAYKQFSGNGKNLRKVRQALEIAIEKSCVNVPALENTLVVVDNSGSMSSPVAGSEHMKCAEMGAVFGMILAKRSNADLMEFGTSARYIKYNLRDSVMEFGAKFERMNQVGHGTNFNAIFDKANQVYDRIVIFSDMQGWVGGNTPDDAFAKYRRRTGAKPFVYSIDLRGYGTMQFKENQVFQLAGFSDKIFDLMTVLEKDRKVLVNKINAIELD